MALENKGTIMHKASSVADNLIRWFVYGILAVTVMIVAVALFSSNTKGEAAIGFFESSRFNEGWILEKDGKAEAITLPASVDAQKGDLLIIRNTLPADISDKSSLMVRASMEELFIYINGELREQYTSDNIFTKAYYLPSAYVVTELSEQDSGTEVAVHIRVKKRGTLNEILISPGNNVWFGILKNNIEVNAFSLIVLILGIILIIASSIMKYFINDYRASFFLGLLMTDISIWVFSESNIRQIIFARPSLSGYFAYFSVEVLAVFCLLFFDEVQHRKYHDRYVVIEAFICLQMVINTILNFTGIAEFHQTLIFSHIWMALGVVLTITNVITDIRTKRIEQYSATAIGIVCLLVCSLIELVNYYAAIIHGFGTFICIGLMLITIATVTQTLIDQIKAFKEREKNQTKMVISTIETIAGAIDAKDEYTGGHSERVGHYAAILARGMAETYGFSEEDILRIQYIGNMHDIGKIGVTDSILNKAGRLSDEEFSLMKKHVDIGAELIIGIDKYIEGLVDGILYHHEKFDGKGYPKGLSGTEIPLVARIICLADCYDAMTSNRVYRKRLSNDDVRAEFIRCSGTQFDPALTEIFIQLMDSGELVPYTVDGMATAETGHILKSAQLENYLQKNSNSEEAKAKHPNRIRMLCYIMKLKEKKGEGVHVFLLKLHDSSDESLKAANELIKPFMQTDDINIEYNDNKRIITLFGKTDEQIGHLKKALQDSTIKIDIEQI